MKKIVLILILLSMPITAIYSNEKEKVYILVSSGKSPGYLGICFVIKEKDSCLVKFIRYEVGFSYRNKSIRYIRKMNFRPTERYRYEKLENGDIWIKYNESNIKRDYHSTKNFRRTRSYEVFRVYMPDLFEMDNYEMLEYLDKNFTKYYGPKEYRDVPVLKR